MCSLLSRNIPFRVYAFIFLQRGSIENLLVDQGEKLDKEQDEKPKKKKKSKKLKHAQIGVFAFNRFQHPNRIIQRQVQETTPRTGRQHYRPFNKTVPVPEGYRQMDAPPLPFTQRTPNSVKLGNTGRNDIATKAYDGLPSVSLQQHVKSQYPPLTAVSPITDLRGSLKSQLTANSVNQVNGSPGSQPILSYPNSQLSRSLREADFTHPPPSEFNAQKAWRKTGNVAQVISKPNFIRRKSILEITDVENTEEGTEVFESDV